MLRPGDRGAPVRDAVMAGHRGDLATATELARHADPAVRAAALGALCRLGALDAPALAAAVADDDPSVRRRACLLAGRLLAAAADDDTGEDDTGDDDHERAAATDLVVLLTRTLGTDDDPSVVEVAAWALGEAGPRCGPDAVRALEQVARTSPDALCREAAVAALGAVGDAGALDTVLGALDDKPAVRRRAAVALAAFDDPRVDDALRRCLDDRDWQVRQAAEDLLGRP